MKRPGKISAEIRKLAATIAAADRSPGKARKAEERLKALAEPACITSILPILIRNYPPSQATDCAIRVLHSLNAATKSAQYLVRKLNDRRWKIRAASATVLESFPLAESIKALVSASNDGNIDVRIGAIHTIWVWSLVHRNIQPIAFAVCKRSIRHESPGVRGAAFECLSHMKDAGSKKLLALAAADPHWQIRQLSKSWLTEPRQIKGGR